MLFKFVIALSDVSINGFVKKLEFENEEQKESEENKFKKAEKIYCVQLKKSSKQFVNLIEAQSFMKANKDSRLFIKDHYDPNLNSTDKVVENVPNSESTFSSPSEPIRKGPYDRLKKFRTTLESGNSLTARALILDCPRLLINLESDSPTILHDGFRLNALHIATRAKQLGVCSMILEMVENIDFLARATQVSDKDFLKHYKDRMLSLFLNIGEGGFNETPLHIASKNGLIDLVQLFGSYPQLDRERRNKQGQTSWDIACSMINDHSPELLEEVREALCGTFVVSLVNGELCDKPEIIISPMKDKSVCEKGQLRAKLGPMSPQQARDMKNLWQLCRSSHKDYKLDELLPAKSIDTNKGYEQVGRYLASKNKLCWIEYWDFLDDFINFESDQGLSKLESYFYSITLNKVVNHILSSLRQLISNCKPEDISFNENPPEFFAKYDSVSSIANKLSNLDINMEKRLFPGFCFTGHFYDQLSNKLFENRDNLTHFINFNFKPLLNEKITLRMNKNIIDFCVKKFTFDSTQLYPHIQIYQTNSDTESSIQILAYPFIIEILNAEVALEDSINCYTPHSSLLAQKYEGTDLCRLLFVVDSNEALKLYVKNDKFSRSDKDLWNALARVKYMFTNGSYPFIKCWFENIGNLI
ncbi:MAG: Ankyrin repeat and LEM domain containing 2 [Paramarteilia canceri]